MKKAVQKLTAAPEQEPCSDPRSGSLSSEMDRKILADQIPESNVMLSNIDYLSFSCNIVLISSKYTVLLKLMDFN